MFNIWLTDITKIGLRYNSKIDCFSIAIYQSIYNNSSVGNIEDFFYYQYFIMYRVNLECQAVSICKMFVNFCIPDFKKPS